MEARGGIALAEQNSTLRSQVAMLAWYDMTAALLSRRGPVFPRRYTEALMEWRLTTEWSLLSLNGCPDSLFLELYDIAQAAANMNSFTPEQAASLEMRVWNAGPDPAEPSSNQHVAGLIDCWRLTLLLYCSRVFRPDDNDEAETRKTLAREIVCLVTNLPPRSAIQKQCLLPMVLAGFEVQAEPLRFIVIDYHTR